MFFLGGCRPGSRNSGPASCKFPNQPSLGLQGFEGEAVPLETQKVKEWSQLHTVPGGRPKSRAYKYQTLVWLPG